MDFEVEGDEMATQRSGAVCAVNRNVSEKVVVRVTSCWIAGSVVWPSSSVEFPRIIGEEEKVETGIEAMNP